MRELVKAPTVPHISPCQLAAQREPYLCAFLRLEPLAAAAWPPPRLLALAGEAAEEDEDAAEDVAFGFWAAFAAALYE